MSGETRAAALLWSLKRFHDAYDGDVVVVVAVVEVGLVLLMHSHSQAERWV